MQTVAVAVAAAVAWPATYASESACPADCCSCASASLEEATACLLHCGFAVVPDMWPADVLDSVSEAFTAFYVPGENSSSSDYHQMAFSSIRGLRKEIALPDFSPFNDDRVIFNARAAGVIHNFYRAAESEGNLTNTTRRKVTLEMASIIHSMAGSDAQDWHQDSDLPEAIKMQVPLVDVPLELGPAELRPLRNNVTCETVHAVTRKGGALLYQHSLLHRGSANRGPRARNVLDFSFMERRNARKYAYLAAFRPAARAAEQRHSDRFAALCAAGGAAGLECDAALLQPEWAGWARLERKSPPLDPLASGWSRRIRARKVVSKMAKMRSRIDRESVELRGCLHRALDASDDEAAAMRACRHAVARSNRGVRRYVKLCQRNCVADYAHFGTDDKALSETTRYLRGCLEKCVDSGKAGAEPLDGGPWLCGEADCYSLGLPEATGQAGTTFEVSCARLRPACMRQFDEVWYRPPGSFGEALVADKCPKT